MTKSIIIISGPISAGKTTLAKLLAEEHDMKLVRTKELLRTSLNGTKSADRISLQRQGDKLDRRTKGQWVANEFTSLYLDSDENTTFVIDSARIPEQVEAIRAAFRSVTHVHLTASASTLWKRYDERRKSEKEIPTYDDIKKNATEKSVERLADIADIVIDTDRSTPGDIFVRVTSRLPFFNPNGGYVDVLVGGQYGSEGKGQIVNYLAKDYDLIVRVGGPNAGHTVPEIEGSFTYHIIPSGSRTHQARLLLAPGMVINVGVLRKEIAECKTDVNRLSIDPQVMTINQADIDKEKEGLVKNIGSTGQGVGIATARRITGRGDGTVTLAKDVKDLQPFIRKASEVLEEAMSNNERILIEGTQGTGLSLYHGDYPYVTSRDTTASGCLSEAGISPRKVRRIIMVCRTYPIRVQSPPTGTSGNFSHELDWKEISRRSGIPYEELKKREKTSTTKRDRRVGEFDWRLLRKAAFLNGPTDIALTFVDYLSSQNAKAFRFDQLDSQTIKFIQEVERVAAAPVSLIATGFGARHVIDRRSW